MTTVIRTGHTNAPGTWVEDQRERLERSSDRTPGHLLPEDGIGVVLGGIIGAAAALLVAVTVLLAASPVASGTATGLTVFAGIAGLVGLTAFALPRAPARACGQTTHQWITLHAAS
ncbi:MAG: hypothetical protein KDB35_03895, partial [Acidimicrobiales bacterium]|nr:hypothetical protein [Acidimicrobiales bacterium]